MRTKITVVLLDDEPRSLDVLSHYAQEHPLIEVVAKFTDPNETLIWFRENTVDLLITDIDMPGLNGIDCIHSLVNKPLVILCTALPDKFARRGYEVSPVDFLEKPVRYAFFRQAIEKVCFRLSIEPHELKAEIAVAKADATYVIEVGTGHSVRVDFDDIKYIESKDKLITIHCLNYSVVTRTSLKALLHILPYPDFMQVHRSFIVVTDLVYRLEEGSLKLRDVEVGIPIGDFHAQDIRKFISERHLRFPDS